MKVFFFIIFLALSVNSYSQKNQSPVQLTKGQTFIVKDTLIQDTDLGMGMGMKNNTTTQNKFVVLDIKDKNYLATKTLTDIKILMDMMGQTVNYDSDKKEDSASEMGKSIKNFNVPDSLMIDKTTADVTFTKTSTNEEKDAANPFENVLESMGNVSGNNSAAPFFVIPSGKKAGDSWMDSTVTKEVRSVRKYILQSVDKDIATVLVEGEMQSNLLSDVQGMQITIAMNTKSTGDIIVDKKTSLINRRTLKADITGTLEMMGQSLPVTGNASTITVVEKL